MPSDDAALIALAIGNSAMLLVLDSLNEYVRLGLDDDLTAIKTWMRRHDSAVGAPAA